MWLKNYGVRSAAIVTGLLILFLGFRFTYAVRFPLVESESTNIRFGTMMVVHPHLRFATLTYTNKQPLAFWLFGSMRIATGSLVVGPRSVSIFFGLVTIFFMYLWVRRLSDSQSAMYAVVLMTFFPLFIHFQTIALLESIVLAATTVCFWSVTAYGQTRKLIYPLILGVAIAVGFWTKTTSFIPSILSIFAMGYIALSHRPVRFSSFVPICSVLAIIFILTIPLVMQPNFYRVLSDPTVFTINDFFKFPIFTWFSNLWHVSYSLAIYGGPMFILSLITGIFHSRSVKYQILLVCAIALLIVPVVVNTLITTRYYAASVIPLIPVMALGLRKIFVSSVNVYKIIGLFCLAGTMLLSLLLAGDARLFFRLFPKNNIFNSERAYAFGWTGGYATREAMSVLNDPQRTPVHAAIAVQDFPGNPTDYVLASYYFNSNRPVVFLNTAKEIDRVSPYKNILPVYFITRSNVYHGDLEPYFTKLYSFRSPESEDFVEIYKMK